ncbi:hypothetical protein [Paraburkholderia sp. XV]|uniref:hypothetical protein n=1 Tax=Paraburkholderia sp. XV TaxID=2831520 RepID=UPI001CD7548E|nr:hypothetical protein [Paraburkholderia sp. XV]
MPANIRRRANEKSRAVHHALGPRGPFPDTPMTRTLERRWLHYALLSTDGELGLVANVAWLGPACAEDARAPQCTTILLLHRRDSGWEASQFNARTAAPLWSAFHQPHDHGQATPLRLAAVAGAPAVDLLLSRTSHPCVSQCAPFADDQHLRWQSETGVTAQGEWSFKDGTRRLARAVGYHERVRGFWGWPELGGWVFGFANAPTKALADGPTAPPAWALVFTFINPPAPVGATTASLMLWRDGRMVRHFARRNVSMAVRGQLSRDKVRQVPELANLFGVAPMAPIPSRLVITGAQGDDRLLIDLDVDSAARVVIPSETSLQPFSVHEVIGPVRVHGRLNGADFAFETRGIAEFAGGAGGD